MLDKILTYCKKYRDLIYIVVITLCCLIISKQISRIDSLNGEIDRWDNNVAAMTEQMSNYVDELGRANAEKHAFQLTQTELRDSIGLLKKKNREYLSYINSHMEIRDTVLVETFIERDSIAEIDSGNILFTKDDKFGQSSRTLSVTIPYVVNSNRLYTKEASFTLNQNIFVEGWLERNTKTNETYVHMRTDYPGLTFNSGMGVVVQSDKAYERNMRKNCGIGISVGPNVSMSYDFINHRLVPTVGIGLTVGFNYTPKWLQW